MTPFFEKLGEMTNNKYSYLKLKEAIVDKDAEHVILQFVIPQDLSQSEWNSETVCELENYVKDILPSDWKAEFRYTKSVLDEDVFIKVINDFFKNNHRALIGQIDNKNITVKINEKNVDIILSAFDIAIQYCKEKGVIEELKIYLNRCFCADKISISFHSLGKPDSTVIKQNVQPVYVDKGRIDLKKRYTFSGGTITGTPKYICNYQKPNGEAIICGRMENFERKISKKSGKIYYNFTLNDSTGEMRCIAFTRSKKEGVFDYFLPEGEFISATGKRRKMMPSLWPEWVTENSCIVVEGEIIDDTFKKGLSFIVRKAGACIIDFDEVTEKRNKSFIMRKQSHRAEPVPYSGSGASDLFDMVEEPCSYILNNKFVVFDLETTGLDTTKARIIELGAVKVENGQITSYYNSLVDPKMPIPADASKVNNIFDSDVYDAPYIEDCLQDFMDYCKDSILVAHNGDYYDFKILRRECYEHNIPMDNKLVDSLTLSRKACPDFPNHKLDTLCKKLNVQLINAHRAYFDAEATAKVFIKLCNKMKLKG